MQLTTIRGTEKASHWSLGIDAGYINEGKKLYSTVWECYRIFSERSENDWPSWEMSSAEE